VTGNAENHKSPEESTKISVTDVDTPIDCQIKTKLSVNTCKKYVKRINSSQTVKESYQTNMMFNYICVSAVHV